MTTSFFAGGRESERGIAIVLSLFLMMAMSIIAASLMFMSQTETYASMNYRLMSQARYGAESGLAKAANYLMYTYTAPVPGGADDLASFTYNGVSPVTCCGGQPVVLSANPSVASNYPVAGVQTAFNAAVAGTLAMSSANVQYKPSATLMSMRQINIYGGGVQTIQTWQIVSDGVVSAGRTAQVEVTATIESVPVPAHTYGAFATNGGCGALTFSGSDVVNSYDSSTYNPALGGAPTGANGGSSNSGGNVGTNGNLGESGNATIDGTLSTPRVGVGSCSNGNVDALSSSGHAKLCPDPNQACNGIQDVNADIVHLPQAVNLQAPPAPNPMPPTTNVTINGSTTCAGLGLSAPQCTGSAGSLTLNPSGGTISLGNINLTGGANINLAGGNYSINSLSFGANSNITIAPNTGAVIMNVAGVNQTTPIDFTGGSFSNASYDPSKFQILYGGNANITLTGNSTAAAMVYAPNAAVTLTGNNDFYGSIVGSTFTETGNATLHYDRHLSSSFYTAGNAMLSSFSWKRF